MNLACLLHSIVSFLPYVKAKKSLSTFGTACGLCRTIMFSKLLIQKRSSIPSFLDDLNSRGKLST